MITAHNPRPMTMERPSSRTPEPESFLEPPGSPKITTTMPKSLPTGWKREVVVRKNGLSAGKSDVYYYSPCGKKFRSKPQIAKFLGENHNLDLSCFDFSRGAYGEVTQRRRARDRQINKKMESVKPIPVVKPLTVNPLRASGPIRRTCGVIKLPVTWVAPPDDELGTTNLSSLTAGEQKSQIHLIVQTLWEKRLFGVKPYDHVTGDEISDNDKKVEVKPITPIISKPHSPRNISPIPSLLHSPTSLSSCGTTGGGGGGGCGGGGGASGGGGGGFPVKTSTGILPTSSTYRHHQSLPGGRNTPPLLPALLQAVPSQQSKIREQHSVPTATTSTGAVPNYSVIQQTGQPIIVPQSSTVGHVSSHLNQRTVSPHYSSSSSMIQFTNGIRSSGKPPIAPVAPMVTDRELQLQEERVRLLRQQLMAVSGTNQHVSTSSS